MTINADKTTVHERPESATLIRLEDICRVRNHSSFISFPLLVLFSFAWGRWPISLQIHKYYLALHWTAHSDILFLFSTPFDNTHGAEVFFILTCAEA